MSNTYDRLKERFEGDGQGEYYVNIGLFKNAEVADKSFDVVLIASRIFALTPEINTRNTSKSQVGYQKINKMVPVLRTRLMEIVYLTKAQVNKNKNKRNTDLITLCLKYCTIPLEKLNIKKFCSLALQYHDMLVRVGIVPITAGYSDSDGLDKLLSQ